MGIKEGGKNRKGEEGIGKGKVKKREEGEGGGKAREG